MGRRSRRGAAGLAARVGAECGARGLLGGPLAVAVSGGVDSMTLMHLLVALGESPTVISLDHGIRPESADEVRFVGEAAAGLGLDFVSGALEVRGGSDLSARARAARYGFLDRWLAEHPGTAVALAHHRDDQAETVLDRLIRGAGAGGLSGMGWRRGRYIRPLLGEPRAALEAWARSAGVRWVEDPSNTKGTRGRLRFEVLPLLADVRAGAAAAIARTASLLAEDEALLRSLAAPLLAEDGVSLPQWVAAPGPLRRRAVLALVAATRGPSAPPSAAQIDAALGLESPGRAVALSGGWRLVADGERLRCLPPRPGPAALTVGDWGLWWVASDAPVTVRAPRPGERLGGAPLGERLRAAGVSAALRPYHPVIQRAERIWVPGVWRSPGEKAPVSGRVIAGRRPSASWSGGGPYTQAL